MSDIPEDKAVPVITPESETQKGGKKEKKAAKVVVVPTRTTVPIEGIDAADFGDLPLNDSRINLKREFLPLNEISAANVGKTVWVRARVHNTRAKGKTCFTQLRRGLDTAQLVMCAFGNEGEPSIDLVKFAGKVPNESIVDVYGTVVAPDTPIASCTQKDAEIHVLKYYVVAASINQLPFQLSDANRYDPLDTGNENEETEDVTQDIVDTTGQIRVLQKMRLDNRWIDLRTFANHAIFKLQSRVCQYYRQFFLDKDFIEIHTPKIIPGLSEGGSNVFSLDYFGSKCCLAQSPQLYKQMSVTSDMFKVFEIGPVFRAENSNTHRHMCEFTGLDFEMEITEHYHEVLNTLTSLFVYIFDQINANCQKELSAVNEQYPFTPLKYKKDVLVLTFKEARQMLVDAGENLGEFDDPTTPQEKLLGRLIKEKYDIELYVVDQYPRAIRPFYTMPSPHDPNYSNSYDVFLRGEEITSGAQRIHDMALLARRAQECGIPEDGIAAYLKSFQFGAFPHGGAGVGLERVVMLFLGLNNIRKTSMFPRVPNRMAP